MRNRFTAFAGLALASLSFVSPAAFAQGFEKILPADTLAFVGFDDITTMKETVSASPTGKLWQDPACASLREALTKVLALASKSGLENAGLDPVALLSAVKGPAAFAVLELTEPQVIADKSVTMGGAFALLLDVGQDGESVMTQVEAALTKAKEQGGMTVSAETAGEVEVTLVEFGDPTDDERMQVRFGLAGNTFVVVAGSANVSQNDHMGTLCANIASGAADAALADADGFTDSLAAGEGTGVRMFVDSHTFISRFLAVADVKSTPDKKKIIDGLGLRDFGTLSMFAEFAAEGATSEGKLAWNGQGAIVSGLQTLMPKGEPELFALVPDTVESAIDAHIDLPSTFDHVVATMKELGVITEDELKLNLQMAEQELGMSIRDDLLSKFGTEIAWFAGPVEDETQGLPGTEDAPKNFAVIMRLKDGKKLETIVDEFITKSGMGAARKHTDFQGFNINSMPMPIPGLGTANYVITDDLLVFSLSSELVQGIVRRTASGTDLPNLRGKEDVAALLDEGPKESSLFVVSNAASSMKDAAAQVRTAITELVRSGRPRSTMSPEEGEFLDLMKTLEIPSNEVIEKYLTGYTLTAVTVDSDGTHMFTKQ